MWGLPCRFLTFADSWIGRGQFCRLTPGHSPEDGICMTDALRIFKPFRRVCTNRIIVTDSLLIPAAVLLPLYSPKAPPCLKPIWCKNETRVCAIASKTYKCVLDHLHNPGHESMVLRSFLFYCADRPEFCDELKAFVSSHSGPSPVSVLRTLVTPHEGERLVTEISYMAVLYDLTATAKQ